MKEMLCGYRNDSRLWDEPIDIRVERAIEEQEDADPRTEQEKRLSWICSDWLDALANDSADEWRDIRQMLYGASQTLVYVDNRHDDSKAIEFLKDLAQANVLDCIRRGRFLE